MPEATPWHRMWKHALHAPPTSSPTPVLLKARRNATLALPAATPCHRTWKHALHAKPSPTPLMDPLSPARLPPPAWSLLAKPAHIKSALVAPPMSALHAPPSPTPLMAPLSPARLPPPAWSLLAKPAHIKSAALLAAPIRAPACLLAALAKHHRFLSETKQEILS